MGMPILRFWTFQVLAADIHEHLPAASGSLRMVMDVSWLSHLLSSLVQATPIWACRAGHPMASYNLWEGCKR